MNIFIAIEASIDCDIGVYTVFSIQNWLICGFDEIDIFHIDWNELYWFPISVHREM